MRMIRCHLDAPLTVGQRLQLPEAASAHLIRVLRLGPGAELHLFNGDGADYASRLLAVGKRGAEVEVLARREVGAESPLRLRLAQGVARGEKMDLILQKATELGVAEVLPLFTARSEVRLDRDRLQRRMQHWRGVIASACEQCGRARLPGLAAPVPLDALLAEAGSPGLRLTLDPLGRQRLADLNPPDPPAVLLVIGPEGGLAPDERARLTAAGFVGLRLGPRVLRTETAGLAALAALQARFGDLG